MNRAYKNVHSVSDYFYSMNATKSPQMNWRHYNPTLMYSRSIVSRLSPWCAMYGPICFSMAVGMSSAAITRSSKRNTMVLVVSFGKMRTTRRNESKQWERKGSGRAIQGGPADRSFVWYLHLNFTCGDSPVTWNYDHHSYNLRSWFVRNTSENAKVP